MFVQHFYTFSKKLDFLCVLAPEVIKKIQKQKKTCQKAVEKFRKCGKRQLAKHARLWYIIITKGKEKNKKKEIKKMTIKMGWFFVEYIENGVKCSDSWSEKTLLDEIKRGEVEIVGIMPQLTD